MLTPEQRKARARLAAAAATARRSPSDISAGQAVEESRRQYRYVSAEAYIKQLVDAAPVLTADQRNRLALLLRPTSGTAA